MKKQVKAEYLHYIFIVMLALVYALCRVIESNPDTDSYFLMNTGKYILENGVVPTDNVWTMHEGFKIIIQQPLCCIINYLAYDFGGLLGLNILAGILVAICLCILYKYIVFHDNTLNKREKAILMIVLIILLAPSYTSRPYTMVISVIALELMSLEKFHQSDVTMKSTLKFYVSLILLTIFQANYQSASLVFLMIMILPFMVPAVWEKKWYKNINWRQTFVYIGAFPIIAISSLCNPNGYKGSLYLYYSYGSAARMVNIKELMSPEFLSFFGIVMVIFVVLFIKALLDKKCSKQLIYLCLGTFLLAMIHTRNYWLLIFPLLQLILLLNPHKLNKELKTATRLDFCIVLILYMITLVVTSFIIIGKARKDSICNINNHENSVTYLNENYKPDDVVLFTDFSIGQYFQFYGYKTYIDARPELYVDKINGKENILQEYKDVLESSIDYNAFIDKYDFTHFCVDKGRAFDVFLYYNDNYKVVAEDDYSRLYETVNIEDR